MTTPRPKPQPTCPARNYDLEFETMWCIVDGQVCAYTEEDRHKCITYRHEVRPREEFYKVMNPEEEIWTKNKSIKSY